MQNVIHYIRLVETGGYRFIGTSGFQRTMQGLDSFSEKVLVRGDFKKLDALFLPGTAHPNSAAFPDFFVNGISGGQIIPANNETMCIASIEYQGIMNMAKRPIMEEYGVYIIGKYFAASGGSPTFTVPSALRDTGVVNFDFQQMVPSYRRTYVATTAPTYPIFNESTGAYNKPAGFAPPTPPVAISWVIASQATGNVPNDWCLSNRSVQQTRLAGVNGAAGALVKIFNVSEEWLWRPKTSTVPSN